MVNLIPLYCSRIIVTNNDQQLPRSGSQFVFNCLHCVNAIYANVNIIVSVTMECFGTKQLKSFSKQDLHCSSMNRNASQESHFGVFRPPRNSLAYVRSLTDTHWSRAQYELFEMKCTQTRVSAWTMLVDIIRSNVFTESSL